jgi:hypothetical protein
LFELQYTTVCQLLSKRQPANIVKKELLAPQGKILLEEFYRSIKPIFTAGYPKIGEENTRQLCKIHKGNRRQGQFVRNGTAKSWGKWGRVMAAAGLEQFANRSQETRFAPTVHI